MRYPGSLLIVAVVYLLLGALGAHLVSREASAQYGPSARYQLVQGRYLMPITTRLWRLSD